MSESAAPTKGFRIGAVARLTGISPDTLRVWERRYQVTEPQRSASGTRLYGPPAGCGRHAGGRR